MPLSDNSFDLPEDLDIALYRSFYPSDASDQLFLKLTKGSEVSYEQQCIKLFGKRYQQPRLSSWHGDPNCIYTYSNTEFQPKKWTPTLLKIKDDIENHTNKKFNSVLLNLYRNGSDSMGLHSDDEKELGKEPYIASLSLGEDRPFRFVHKTKSIKQSLNLENGDLLIMKGQTQKKYKHELPKSKKKFKARLNLTFRFIYPEAPNTL